MSESYTYSKWKKKEKKRKEKMKKMEAMSEWYRKCITASKEIAHGRKLN